MFAFSNTTQLDLKIPIPFLNPTITMFKQLQNIRKEKDL